MPAKRAEPLPWIIALGVVAATIGAERLSGRLWWCDCGQAYPWVSDIWSKHCSQHLVDPYVFSHVAHGLLFYGMLAWIPGPWQRMTFGWTFCVAHLVECAWEVLENSDVLIQRYRAETIAIGYTGDSIVNSIGDVLAAALGVVIARAIGWKWTLALFIALEIALAIAIKDSLFLNVLMLVWPIEAIKQWQSSGQDLGVALALPWP